MRKLKIPQFTKGRIGRRFFFIGSVCGILILFLLGVLLITLMVFLASEDTCSAFQTLQIIFICITASILSIPFSFFVFFLFGLLVRRLHDLNLSGYWSLVFLPLTFLPPFYIFTADEFSAISFMLIPFLILTVIRGKRGENKYGKPLQENIKFREFKKWNHPVEIKWKHMVLIIVAIIIVAPLAPLRVIGWYEDLVADCGVCQDPSCMRVIPELQPYARGGVYNEG